MENINNTPGSSGLGKRKFDKAGDEGRDENTNQFLGIFE